MQSGAGLFAFVALLLLALPLELTFHTLLALPRLAERTRTFWAYSLHPMENGLSLPASAASHQYHAIL